MPATIATTGNDDVDSATAELAVYLRDAGLTECCAVIEAQRLRDLFMNAGRDDQ